MTGEIPIDETDDALQIDMGHVGPRAPMTLGPLEGGVHDPQTQLPTGNQRTAWSENLFTEAILGPGECWLGEVLYVHNAAVDGEIGQKGVIEVQRTSHAWDGTDLVLDEIPPVASQPTVNIVHALPHPVIDQQAYLCAVGDPVIVLSGRDGLYYYLPDDKPFLGKVITWQERELTALGMGEDATGGAGNWTVSVERLRLQTDPDGDTFDWLATAFGEMGGLLYDRVFISVADGQHHGYRVDDKIFVHRRGQCFFAEPKRETFLAVLTDAGPAESPEADFTDPRYWAQEVALDAEHSAANTWDYEGHTLLDRLVCATNRAEIISGTHALAVNETIYVVVTMGRNMDTSVFTNDPYYSFYYLPTKSPVVIKDSFCISEIYTPLVHEGDLPTWGAILAVDKTGDPLFSSHISCMGHMYLDASGKLNPWFVLNLGPYITTTVEDHGGDIFCTNTANLNAYDITGTQGTYADVYADGVMYQDDDDKWNPRIAIDPSKFKGTCASPLLLEDEDEFGTPGHDTTLNEDSWDRSSQGIYDGVELWQMTRSGTDGGGDWWCIYRKFKWDSMGMLSSISAEVGVKFS